MPKKERYEPGTFCWAELSTSDGNDAKRFYTGLFGWEAADNPMGPDMVYTMLRLRGSEIGALYKMQPDEAGRGIPPHWNCYVSVENADETARKVKQHGGMVHAEPFDVMEFGRMAVLQDPAGAAFCAWQPKQHIGTTLVDDPGAPCWYENLTRDPAAAAAFYRDVFGWTTKQDPVKSDYTELYLGKTVVGGMMPISPEMGPMPSNWGVYFAVADCDASSEKARSLGGKVHKPPADIPEVGRFAVLADPQGAWFSIIRLLPGAR
ncbi:MAG: VOC family protein [Acidobacteriota bacterium]|nr:VOC family protein [Acidobacteriota bacterium]